MGCGISRPAPSLERIIAKLEPSLGPVSPKFRIQSLDRDVEVPESPSDTRFSSRLQGGSAKVVNPRPDSSQPAPTLRLGITVRALLALEAEVRRFIAHNSVHLDPDTASTEDVVYSVFTQLTGARKCRLAELDWLVDPADLGPPKYFVSHCWRAPFALLVQTVAGFCEKESLATRVWLDVAAVNQHGAWDPEPPSQACHFENRADTAAVEEVIQACTAGTIVVADWGVQDPVQRAWCLFEWDRTIAAHGMHLLHLPLAAEQRERAVAAISLAHAECTHPADHQDILARTLQHHDSLEAFNRRLKLALLLQPVGAPPSPLRRAQRMEYNWAAVDDFLASPSQRAMCVTAGTAEGKTSMCYAMQEHLSDSHASLTVGMHFLNANHQRLLNTVQLLKNLAFQLALASPPIARLLLSLDLMEAIRLKDYLRACEKLVMRPMEQRAGHEEFLIVIDGLQEADPPLERDPEFKGVVKLLGNECVQLLKAHLSRLPACKFIFTSSPDAASHKLMSMLESMFQGLVVLPLEDLQPAYRQHGDNHPQGMEARHADSGITKNEYKAIKDVLLDAQVAATLEKEEEEHGDEEYADKTLHHTTDEGLIRVLSVHSSGDKSLPLEPSMRSMEASAISEMLGNTLPTKQARPAVQAPLRGVMHYHEVVRGCGMQDEEWALPPGSVATMADLYRAYEALFQRHVDNIKSSSAYALIPLLEVLLAAQEPLGKTLLEQLGMQELVECLPGWGVVFFYSAGCLCTIHNSVLDWLRLHSKDSLPDSLPGKPSSQASRWRDSISCSVEQPSSACAATRKFSGGRNDQSARWVDVSVDVARGHWVLARMLAELRTSSAPPPYCLRYLYAHLTAATAPVSSDLAAVMDAVVADTGFLAKVVALGCNSDTDIRDCLLTMPLEHHTRLSLDMARWLLRDPYALSRGTVNATEVEERMLRSVMRTCPPLSPLRAAQTKLATSVGAWRCGRMLGRNGDMENQAWGAKMAKLTSSAGAVFCVACSHDGRHVVSGGEHGSLLLWDVVRLELRATLGGHVGEVFSVAVSPDARTLVSGGQDCTVKIWDGATGEERCCFGGAEGHVSVVYSVAVSPDSRLAVSGSADRSVRVWDVQEQELLATLTGHGGKVRSVAFSPDGTYIVSGSADASICVWEVGTWRSFIKLEGHLQTVTSAVFSPSGQEVTSGSDDGTVKVWVLATGKQRLSLEANQSSVLSVAMSADSALIASAGRDETIRLWDFESGELQATLRGHSHWVSCVEFSPNSRVVVSASGDKSVQVWDAAFKNEFVAETVAYGTPFHTDRVLAVGVSPDSSLIASSSKDSTVKIWKTKTGEHVATLMGHQMDVHCLHFSPCGNQLISGGADRILRIWDMTKRTMDNIINAPHPMLKFEGHTLDIFCVQFSPDGEMIASGGGDLLVRLWDRRDGRCKGSLRGHTHAVTGVAWSSDNEQLVTGSQDRTVRVWDAATFSHRRTLIGHTHWVRAVGFSADRMRVVSASDDRTVRVWEAHTGRCLKVLKGHAHSVVSVAFSPNDDTYIVSGGRDKTVRVWDGKDGEHLAMLEGHTADVTCVQVSPNGHHQIVSSSNDKTVRIWVCDSRFTSDFGPHRRAYLLRRPSLP